MALYLKITASRKTAIYHKSRYALILPDIAPLRAVRLPSVDRPFRTLETFDRCQAGVDLFPVRDLQIRFALAEKLTSNLNNRYTIALYESVNALRVGIPERPSLVQIPL